MKTPVFSRMTLLLLSGFLCFSACEKSEFASTIDGSQDEIDVRSAVSVEYYALTNTNTILVMNGEGPEMQNSFSITGLQSGESIVAIDFRPSTGQLYGVSNQSRIYFINLNSGAATALSQTPFPLAMNASKVGFDFNPTVDRIRLVTDQDQNARLHPETGALAFTDGSINPGAAEVTAVAYTNSFSGATTTVLYDIDVVSNSLFKQNPPNNGTLDMVGALTIDPVEANGFDISPDNTTALAVMVVYDMNSEANVKSLYKINLATGKATNMGSIDEDVIGLAIRTNPVAYAVDRNNNMLIFNPEVTATPISKPISGLQVNEKVVGIDMRPATGQLYALGSSSRLYVINMSSGAAVAVGPMAFTPALSGTSFGFDFNPTVDRIRIVSNNGQNLRAHPTTGAIVMVDGSLNPGTPVVDAVAYTNSFAGSTSTTLYDIDILMDKLFIQAPPNNGTLVEVGELGPNADARNGFDIGGHSNEAYFLFTNVTQTVLYTVNLSSGASTPKRRFNTPVNGLAIGLGF